MKTAQLLVLLVPSLLNAGEQSKYFNRPVAESNPLRTEQVRELDEYIKTIADDDSHLKAVFKPDYSSQEAFVKSAKPYRQSFCDSIGYPPPGTRPGKKTTFKQIGEDSLGVYYRAMIPILPRVHSEGIYIVPKSAKGKTPLVISMHGGGGSPEVALFIRGGVKLGYVVYAPQHLFQAKGYSNDIRRRIDDRMRLIGTSITAVEIAKITYAIDELIKRPEVDRERIAMVGLSYGGFYAQVTPAIDTRIQVSVSSCYFGVQEYRYERDELSVPTDFRFPGRATLFNDADKVALIAPRSLQIQAGANDVDSHRAKGAEIAPRAAAFYERLNISDRFEHVTFDGGHEFDDASAWTFVTKHL